MHWSAIDSQWRRRNCQGIEWKLFESKSQWGAIVSAANVPVHSPEFADTQSNAAYWMLHACPKVFWDNFGAFEQSANWQTTSLRWKSTGKARDTYPCACSIDSLHPLNLHQLRDAEHSENGLPYEVIGKQNGSQEKDREDHNHRSAIEFTPRGPRDFVEL